MAGSGSSFKMDFGGFDKVLGHAVSHFQGKRKELMEECGEVIVSGIDDAFEAETAPDGTKWKKSGRAKKEAGCTLDDTSELRNSIGYEATADEVAFGIVDTSAGTNVDYAVYHQQPERDGKIMPKREFIGISDDTAEELNDVLDDFMQEGFRR